MELILLEKVANLGALGDVVKVKNGYGRNYLVPKGIAKQATPENIAEFERNRAEFEKKQADHLASAQSMAEKLDGLMLQITRKAGVDGRLFGSVTNRDIAEALAEAGYEIAKSTIRMPEGPIKQIGDTALTLALHSDVLANITVSVLGDQS